MPEETTKTETVEETTIEPTAEADAPLEAPPEDAPPEHARLHREAARHRAARRAAETERDQLRERVGMMQRREVERLASTQLAAGEDVFHEGAELAAFLNEEGEVDAEKVKVAAAGIVSKRPGLAARRSSFDGGQLGAVEQPKAPSFAEGFRRAARR